MFRVLAFQPEGKELVRGPQARGTLALLESEQSSRARFVRDIDGGVVEMDFERYEIIPAVPTNRSVVLTLPDGKRHTFIAFKELPPSDETRFMVLSTGVNPVARYQV